MLPRPRSRPFALERLEPRVLLAADGLPGAPPTLAARAVSPSEVALTWDLGDAADTAIVVERQTGATGTFAPLAVLPAGENLFTDTGCRAETTYVYRVKARGSGGDSGFSPQRFATTPPVGADAYPRVTDLVVTAASATSAVVSFGDPHAGAASYLLERSRDGLAFAVVASLGAETRFVDTALEPGGRYVYRARATGWARPTGDFSEPVTVVLPARPAAAPAEPIGVDAVALSATAVRVDWKTQEALPAAAVVERSVRFDPWRPLVWETVATTGVGATSFTDTGLDPETPYVYRVRATRGGALSEPGRPASDVMHALFGTGVGVVTASAGSGAVRTWDIGPGRALSRLGDLDWSRLGPGDTVNIHFKPGGYHEIVQISSRGTPGAWITVNGVPDPVTGAPPTIDGRDAVLAPQFRNHWEGLAGFGAVVVGTRPGFIPGYKPGYIAIRGLEIRDASSDNSFIDADGARKPYGRVGAGIYLERCDHVTIVGCTIHRNGEGIFGAGQSTFDRLMTDIVVDSNHIVGNGNVGSDREHNTYIEAIGTTYQFNRYGPPRAGALGAGLKDRSVGTVIRGNWIVGGFHQLQLPEAQNQADLAVVLPAYRTTLIQGNTLVAPPGNAASPIWFGGDQGLAAWYRKGILYVHHNTIVARSDRSQAWKVTAIVASSGGEAIDVRGNVIAALPATPGGTAPELGLVGGDNHAFFGRNWVSAGWLMTTTGDYTFSGQAGGTANLLSGSTVDPGFLSAATGDYRLAPGSVCVDAAGRLPGGVAGFPLTRQFRLPIGSVPRAADGPAADLGAFEATSATRLQVVVAPGARAGVPVDVTLTARLPGGSVATGYRGTVRFASDDAWALLPDAVSFTALDAGTRVVRVVFSTGGIRRIDAGDGALATRVAVAVAPAAALVSPGDPRATALGPTAVAVEWSDRSTDETGFVIERWQPGTAWVRVGSTGAGVTRFVDGSARPATGYAYRVAARGMVARLVRSSAPTDPVLVRTPPASA